MLTKGKLNVYELLDQFVSYLLTKQNISVKSLDLYMAAVRSYLMYYDIDIVPGKFRRRVKIPKSYADPEEPLSLSDIRDLLEFCANARLTCYLLLLVSSGLRPAEAASLKVMDVDFTTSPTKLNIRIEINKTKRGRVVYCSDEATAHLQKLLKFRKNDLQPETLIFSVKKEARSPQTIYVKMLHQFEKLQKIADKDQRKENSKRHKITLHSFRRTAYSIINEQTNTDFANWFLGHNHSVYWTHKEQERREIYRTKCMPFLTIYQDSRNETIETTLKEKASLPCKFSTPSSFISSNMAFLANLTNRFPIFLYENALSPDSSFILIQVVYAEVHPFVIMTLRISSSVLSIRYFVDIIHLISYENLYL